MWIKAYIVGLVILLIAAYQPASAQAQSLRGQLISVDGSNLVVDSREGSRVNVTLGDSTAVFLVSRATLDDVKAGRFIGVTSIDSGDRRVALEVHIFDEALRGLGEGHYPWDLIAEPNMMTNANIANVVARSGENEIKLEYVAGEEKTPGEQTIFVSSEIPIVHFNPSDRSVLAAGEHVLIFGARQDDGSFAAQAVVIGSGGVKPPL